MFRSINPEETNLKDLHGYLLGSIGPRPIALASTISESGIPNLAPFSYFNVFSTRPPIVIVGPNRSGRTAINKDTAINAFETFEIAINIVNYSIAEQMNIAGADFDKDINEFSKSGLTPIPSDVIKPFRVKESPVHLECKVSQFVALGSNGGAGNLIICDVKKIHIQESMLDENNKVDQTKIDLIGRMGGPFYCRANGDALFKMPKIIGDEIIGYDALPNHIKNSHVLSGNDIGKLAQLSQIPTSEEIQLYNKSLKPDELEELNAGKHLYAKKLIENRQIKEALLILWNV